MRTAYYVTARFYQVLLIKFCRFLPFSASAVTLPPPSAKACPQALYICIMSIGRSYLNIPLIAYYLRYTSTLPTCLGTLAV